MAFSKTSKVWFSAVVGGLLAAAGGVLLVTGVGSGAGAVMITSGLAAIGGIVGGGMLAGIGVLAAGSATVAALSAAVAHKAIKDPELLDLAKKLRKANELYEAAGKVDAAHKKEIEHLNKAVGELLRAKKKDREKLEELKARLLLLIQSMKKS
jgi:hypothetical protein